MSDFEDYAYSPYDDFEDLLYDADPAPELADDLAEHAVHSPVWEGEIAGSELQDYFSDWEYYSDDYMDDDPVLLKANPQVGSPPKNPFKRTNDENQRAKRGKKRKLAEATEKPSPDAEDADLITRCIRGTVWAKPTARGPPPYKAGQESRVALMKNWKEAFAITDNGWHRNKSNMNDDESWAKDMSLEDMGLKNVQGPPIAQEREPQEAVSDEGSQDEEDDLQNEMEEVSLEESRSNVLPVGSEGVSGDELPRKRRRIKPDVPSPPRTSSAEVIESEDTQTGSTHTGQSTGKATDKTPSVEEADENRTAPVKTPALNGLNSSRSRKRKAEKDDYNGEAGPLKSTASSRAKRVASTKSKTIPAPAPNPRQTRQTRNGKK
ncbi:hypothetical protein A1O1_08863 [Capronia coronata CBS 617.96]|uniref:Uncharacterized protein n=1 Tax=Capronia coronata CBS 617.96 TaxID=1182541 RepID=W9XE51_9EURO|nr:uncharacterized protein A1O1_08863 [Capronia coronata CBS 617.96]EXJ78463.1 hypothetical protein A1O1_08863 [Capronia coronata CBS 617.96]